VFLHRNPAHEQAAFPVKAAFVDELLERFRNSMADFVSKWKTMAEIRNGRTAQGPKTQGRSFSDDWTT
jgi:hypothetical protein